MNSPLTTGVISSPEIARGVTFSEINPNDYIQWLAKELVREANTDLTSVTALDHEIISAIQLAAARIATRDNLTSNTLVGSQTTI